MALNYGIPRPESRFTQPDGTISRDWYLFLVSLFNSVGGGTPVAPGADGSVTNDITALENVDNASDLSALIPSIADRSDSLERLVFGSDDAINSPPDPMDGELASNDMCTAIPSIQERIESLERIAFEIIQHVPPADPMMVSGGVTYRYILGKGWIPA